MVSCSSGGPGEKKGKGGSEPVVAVALYGGGQQGIRVSAAKAGRERLSDRGEAASSREGARVCRLACMRCGARGVA